MAKKSREAQFLVSKKRAMEHAILAIEKRISVNLKHGINIR